MRTVRWVALALALALVAAACGNDDDGEATAPSPTADATEEATAESTEEATEAEEPETETGSCGAAVLAEADSPIQITFWHAMSGTNGEVLTELVDEYNASQDDVAVQVAFQGTYAETFDKYINTLRTQGALPQIIQLEETTMQQMIDSQSIVPVQECVDSDGYDTSQFVGGLVDQYSAGGALVSMPFQLSNPVLYYNAADFVEAGLDPQSPPTNLEELLATSRALVDSGVVPQGLSLNTDAWFFEQWVNMAGEPLVNEENGREARATGAALESDAAQQVMDFLAVMRDEGLLLDTGRRGDQSLIDKYLAVAVGNAAMTIGTSAALGEIYSQIGSFPGIEITVAELPGPTGGGPAVSGGSLYLMEGATDEQRAAVWDLMKWLNEPGQQVTWSAGTGYVPTVSGAIGSPELEALWDEFPGFRVAYDQIVNAGPVAGGGGPLIGNYPGFRNAIESGLEQLVGGSDPATVLANAQSQADAAITEYNDLIGE